MKMIKLSTFAIFISFSLVFSCGASGKNKDTESEAATTESVADNDAADSEDEVSIEKVTLARDAGEKFEPVTSFKTSDTFCALVKLSEAKTGTRVKAIWTAVEAAGIENKKIFEKEVTINPETTKDVKEPSRIDFTLSHNNPYPVGDYKAEIYLNGELAKTVKFKIQ